MSALRTSTWLAFAVGIAALVLGPTAGMPDDIAAILFFGGLGLIVDGMCKFCYDTGRLRRRPVFSAVRLPVGAVSIRLSTLVTAALGAALAGTYWFLSANRIDEFGESGDIGGGSLLVAGYALLAVAASKLIYDVATSRQH